MADPRTWTGKDVLVATSVAAVVLVTAALLLMRGPVARRSNCSRYADDYRRELEEGREKYARITARLAAEAGCSWARRAHEA